MQALDFAAAMVSHITTAGERALRKQRHAGLEDSGPNPKRIKAIDYDVKVIFAKDKNVPVDPAEILKKRLAIELGVLSDLVKRAKLCSRSKNGRFLPHEEAPDCKTSSAKRNSSPLPKQKDAQQQQMSPPEEGEMIVGVPEEEEEFVDICGGVSPVAIDATPLDLACSPMSRSSDSGTSSQESSSDSPPPAEFLLQAVSDESVDSLVPPPVLPKEILAQPPVPSSVMEPEKKIEGNLPISVLLARAKEASSIRQQKGNGWERERARRTIRNMEKAVRHEVSIHPRDLEKLGIREFDYVLEEFGFLLKPDAYDRNEQ